MASGFGWGGGRSRCFTYWQEFQKCYIDSSNPQECQPEVEDYLECLHHVKANARALAIQNELIRQNALKAKENHAVPTKAAESGEEAAK